MNKEKLEKISKDAKMITSLKIIEIMSDESFSPEEKFEAINHFLGEMVRHYDNYFKEMKKLACANKDKK